MSSNRRCYVSAAADLIPGGSYNVFGSGNCRVDNTSSEMYCKPGGDSSDPASQVVVSRPDGGSAPIRPGDQVYWKSAETEQYCRLIDDQADGFSTVICDLDAPTFAAVITYTGAGFSYQGRPFIPGDQDDGPAYFGSPGQTAPPTYVTAPALPANAYLNIISPAIGSSYIRNDNTTSLAYAGTGDGSTHPEQYIAQPPGGSPSATSIAVGSPVILRSVQTGLYCRIVNASSYLRGAAVATGSSTAAPSSGKPSPSASRTSSKRAPPPTPTPAKHVSRIRSEPPTSKVRGLLAESTSATEPAAAAAATPAAAGLSRASSQAGSPPPPQRTRLRQLQAQPPPSKLLQLQQVITRYGMVADQATAATASVFLYTGNSLAYNGQQMVATTPGAPLLLSSTALPPTSPNAHFTFKPAGGTAPPLAVPNTGGHNEEEMTWRTITIVHLAAISTLLASNQLVNTVWHLKAFDIQN